LIAALIAFLILGAAIARAQFEDTPSSGTASDGKLGPKLDQALTKTIKVGVKVKAVGGPVKGIVATLPIPIEWPEQKVKVVNEDFSAGAHQVAYRTVEPGGAKQMIVTIPTMTSGEELHAIVSLEITRYSVLPPEDTSVYKECTREKLPKNILYYLGPSPYIESTQHKITELAKEITEGKSDWEKVEAIYDATREKVKYQNGPLKGALRALNEGTGDCEELSSLFIALCRASGVPARLVWVPDHCYAEFYLVDGDGKGYWFPCQAAGSRAFGGIPEHRPILQKGDNFHDPDRPKDKLRYVSQFLKGKKTTGSGQPNVQWVEEWE
jgi:hypothetical protein